MNAEITETTAVPIREISRLTGVNTVTLRAWERRYGLLKPMRTGKGHRLYSLDDIQRVRDIQAWLVRGLAISKVNAILAQGNAQSTDIIDSVWLDYATRVESALAQLNRKSLEALFNELIALYPAELIADALLQPILERLQHQQEFSTQSRLAFMSSLLYELFYFGQSRQRQAARGKRLLLLKLNADDNDLMPLILNYSLLVHTLQSEYLGYVPPSEWVFAIERLRVDGVIIYSDSATSIPNFQQQLAEQQKALNVPFFFAGKIARIFSLALTSPQNDSNNDSDGDMKNYEIPGGENLQAIIAVIVEKFSQQLSDQQEY